MPPTGPARPAATPRGPRDGLGTVTFAVVVLAGLLAVVPATAALGFLLCLLALVPAVLAHRRVRRGMASNRLRSTAAVLMAPAFLVVALVVVAVTAPPQVQTASDATALRDTSAPAAVAPLVAVPAPTSTSAPTSPVTVAERSVRETAARTSTRTSTRTPAPRAARAVEAPPRTSAPARVATPKPVVEPVTGRPSSTSAKAKPTASSKPAPATSRAAACDEDTHYVNTEGACVLRPVAGPVAPADASARCQDGTYSSSRSRSGTCSHHGGVAQWL